MLNQLSSTHAYALSAQSVEGFPSANIAVDFSRVNDFGGELAAISYTSRGLVPKAEEIH
jgi:hypothetical protein